MYIIIGVLTYVIGLLVTSLLIGIFEKYEFGLWNPDKLGEMPGDVLILTCFLWPLMIPFLLIYSLFGYLKFGLKIFNFLDLIRNSVK